MNASRQLFAPLALATAWLAGAAPVVQAQTPAAPTFTRDVAPILQRACQNCHRPGFIAPMSLLTYEEARPLACSIKARVSQRQMPPWHQGLLKPSPDPPVEAKPGPGASRVVHHAVMFLIDPGSNNPMGGVLNEYAVGRNGEVYPDGAGRLMKAGSKVRFDIHYHAVGETIKDRTSIGIVFYPKGYVPKHQMVTVLAPNQDDLDIPAGADNVRSDACFEVDRPARLPALMPHMHNPGKRQCLEAIYPNMVVEQFNCVNYDFQNPDPRNWVRFGNRTTDDMARHWLTFYYMSDAEFQVEVNARKAVKRGTANQQ